MIDWFKTSIQQQNTLINRQNQARDLESQGHIDSAISMYEALKSLGYPHPVPYERLRTIYAGRKQYPKAIEACRAFIQVSKIIGYPERAAKMQEWIAKYEAKLKKPA